MRRSSVLLRSFLSTILLGAAVAFWAGCEDSGGDKKLGDGHDFGNNDPNLVYCIGDSITAGNAVAGLTPYPGLLGPMIGKNVVNAGAGGAMSSHGADIAPGILGGRKPGFLIIFYGAVDAIFDRSIDSTIGNLRSIVQAAKANKTIPIVATCLPQIREHQAFNGTINQLNPRIAQMADEEGAVLADLHSGFSPPESYLVDDGLHPNQAGEQLIATLFADVF